VIPKSALPNPALPNPAVPAPKLALDRAILSLALPAVVENLLLTVVFFSDTLMVGWLRNPAALAAVGLAGTLMYLLITLFNALAISATALVARAWGEGDLETAQRAGAQSMVLTFLLASVVSVLGVLLAGDYLRLIGGEPEVIQVGTRYIQIVLAASMLSFPMQTANGIMRATGDTRTPMWNTLAMNVWNVVVSFLLVFGVGPFPALGLAGAAWGTATARSLGGLLALQALLGRRTRLELRWQDFRQWNPGIAQRIVHLAVPSAVEGSIAQAGHLLFMRMVASLGTTALAAHQIALRVESLSYMPAAGLAIAATTLVGQSLGARQPDRAEAALRRTLLYSFLFNGTVGLVFILFAPQIVGIFGSTPDVLALSALVLAISAVELPGLGMQMIVAGGFRGAGDTRTPLYVTLAGVLVFRLALVYLLAIHLGWGLPGVWWGAALDWTGRALLLWLFFRRGTWKQIVI
jgi:putative MATE family efflux protein